jgi:hypothetical protein
MTSSRSRDFSLAAGALWLLVTLYETLHPVGWVQSISFWSFWDQDRATVDMVENLVLFLPMGWIASRGGWSVRRTALAALLLSAGIELAQHWIPGRASMATDILFNTLGAAFGWGMAMPVTRPRLRVALTFAALATFLGLHALNTAWPGGVVQVGGIGAWTGVTMKPCGAAVGESTACLVIPNDATAGDKLVLVAGAGEHTYARVIGGAVGRPEGRADCVTIRFESTIGVQLALRPPLTRACGLADATDRSLEVRLDPRLEYTARGTWEPTRAGVWMWPVWPFESYRPALLRTVGALTFVIGAAMVAGSAPWWIPAGYLLMLTLASMATGMRGPGLWEVGWTAVAWLVAMLVVVLDARWRRDS